MVTQYPGTIDSFTNPSGTSLLTNLDHALQHTNANGAVVAVETVLGTTAGTSIAKNFAAGDFAVRINGSNVLQQRLSGTIDNAILGTPSITNGTANNIVLGTPAITGGTANAFTLGTPTVSGTLQVSGLITQTGSADHITLTPGASKLVKVAVLRQNGTTNAYDNTSVTLTGWSKTTGDNSISMGGNAVVFGVNFSSYPIVVACSAASKGTPATDPTSTSAQGWLSMEVTSLGTSGFTPYYTRNRKADDTSPGGFGTTLDFICTWLAIGQL